MIRKLLVAIAACAFIGGSSALASSAPTPPARSVNATPNTSYGPFLFCAELNQNMCQSTHGVYAQNTIDTVNTGSARFLMTTDGTAFGGEAVYVLTDGHGNCIKENNSDQVVVGNGGCNLTNNQDRWAYYGSTSSAIFVNVASGDYMSTTNLNNGDKVWGGPITNYYHWALN